jgi:hypothetical protein
MKRFLAAVVLCALCTLAETPRAHAGEIEVLSSQVKELSMLVQDLSLTVQNQQREIALLKGQTPPPFTTSGQAPSAGGRSLQGRWNPDLGVVADTTLKLDSPRNVDTEGADRVSVREVELVFGSPVDPYSRLDATISFSDFEDPSLEEAYYTHFGLPWETTARLGKFKPRVGKALAVHRDSLDTVDEPLVIQRYFGVEGLNKSGVDLKIPVDLPWAVTHEVSMGVLEGGGGEGGTIFGQTRRHPTLYAHLKNYLDVTDVTGLELGVSGMTGSRDADSAFETQVLGFDGTLIHRYADQRHLKLQGEAFRVSKSESFVETLDDATGDIFFDDVDDNRNLWGGYLLADLRFHPQWATGFRFDRVEIADAPVADSDTGDTGYTGYLTFYQSEFARWRAQFTHIDLSNGSEDNQFWLQGTFAIGEHKHKLS